MYLLVTGASGHIGSAIANECNKNKIKTFLLTRSKKKEKILKKRFKNCITLNYQTFKNNKKPISFIIHTASLNDQESNNNKNAIKDSLDITKKILSLMNLNNLKKIIYLSSAQVYGSNLVSKVSENTKEKAINNYGFSRLANEKFLEKISRKLKFSLYIIRISNVVGDPIIFDKRCLRLLPNDIKNQAKKNFTICLRSSGLQSRNFISLQTTAKSIIELEADKLALNSFVPRNIWRNCPPKYNFSEESVIDFANQMGIHPTIVAGRLRKELNRYDLLSKMVNGINVQEYFA